MSNEGIELRVLASTTAAAPTYVDTLTGRLKPQFLDEIGTGGGSFVVSPTDPQLVETPSLLDYRNVVQHCVDGKVIGAWFIRTDDSETIASSEGAAEVRNIAGPGLLEWLDDATLKPSFGYSRFSSKKRFFNFATERGDWYNAAQWTNPAVVGRWGDSPWGAQPDDWPEDSRNLARWVWNGPYTGSGTNRQSPPWVQNTFRMEFTTGDDGGTWIFYIAGDDFVQAWVDGAEVVTTDYTKGNLSKMVKVELTLPAGDHVFAARVTNGPVGPGAFMAALYHNIFGNEVLRRWTGQNTTDWKGNYNPAVVPTWSPGEIMVKILNEAKARGVRSASWLKPTFTSKLDSSGQPWAATTQDWEFEVGGSYLKVLNQILELGYYAWVNPETFELNLSATRGNDRSIDPGGIVFERGKNLRKAASSGVGKVKNSLDIATAEGWLVDPSTKDTASINKYGALEGTWSADVQASVARSLIPRLFKQYSTPEEGASYDILALDEIPFVDYGIADLVLAPDKRDLLVQRRIVSISSEEDDNGQPLYTVEFDTIFKSNEQKLNQIVSNITGGTVGSAMSNSTGAAPSFGDPVKPIGGGSLPPAPKAPTNLAVDSTGSWNATGVTPTSTAILTWDPVVLDLFDNPIIPEYYEVWGKRKGDEGDSLLTTVTGTTASIFPFVPGTTWSFRVRALLTQDGPVSAYTAWQDELMIGPNTPLPAPSAPTLETAQGLLTVKWDGLLINGAAPAPQFRYVYAQVSTDGTLWVTAGSALQRDGRSMNIAGLQIGTSYRVRLIAVDGLGIASAASGIATITVKGIDLGPLEQTLADAKADIAQAKTDIDNLEVDLDGIDIDVTEALTGVSQAKAAAEAARLAAASKSKVWPTGTTPPTSGMSVDDLFVRSTDGALLRYSGTTAGWVVIPLATQAYIQSRGSNLVTNGSATLGDNTNFPGFVFDASDRPTGASGMFTTAVAGSVGMSSELINIDPSMTYELSFAAKQLTGQGNFYSLIAPHDADGQVITPPTYTSFAGTQTTLASPLNPGDTTITLASSAGWDNSATASRKYAAIGGYVDGKGYAWPATVYTRTVPTYASISGNVVTLNAAYTGPARPAGTPVWNSFAGNSYIYPTINVTGQADWTNYSGRVAGLVAPGAAASTQFPRPTAAVKVGFLCNYPPVTAPSKQGFSNIALNEVTVAVKAQQTADGKNSLFQEATAPTASTPGNKAGDIWWVRSIATGIVTAQYEWNGTTWQARTLDNATIANLNAGKLNAGFLSADRIQANSLTAAKLILTDTTNMIDDSQFQFGSTPWTTAGIPVFSKVASVDQVLMPAVSAIAQNHLVAVNPGDELRVTVTYRTAGYTAGEVGIGGPRLTNPGVDEGVTWNVSYNLTESNAAFVTLNLTATVKAGVYALQPRLAFSLGSGRSVTFTEFSVRRKNAAELIVDGSIIAPMIGVDQIQARHMQAGSIDATKIQVGSLVAELFAAGSVTARELAVDAVRASNIQAGAVQTSHLSPSVGTDLDISANNTVTIIAGQAADAQNSAEGTADELAAMQTYYEFGPDGARISTPASPFAVGIRNDRIEMLENGNVVSYWNSGSLYVNQLVGEKVILGNHQLEKYNTGTVVRAL